MIQSLKKLIHLSALLGFLFLPFISSAEALPTTSSESIQTVVIPNNPKPESVVSIQLSSSYIDLGSADITWTVNNKFLQSGKDLKVAKVKIGKAGSVTIVSISINTKDYGLVTKELRFSPGGVRLVYEAETYTPPFYRGKALPTQQSVISLLAITNFKNPKGVTIQPKDLIFTWKKNGEVDGVNSGRGKDTYRYNNGALPTDAPLIEVVASAPEYSTEGGDSIVVESVQPEIIFYEESPLLGTILNKAFVNDLNFSSSEMTLSAFPYYFSAQKKEAGQLSYKFSINGNSVDTPRDSKTKITLRRPDGKGVSSINLKIQNTDRIFQVANNNLSISYGN